MAILERRKEAASLYCRGKPQWEIARHLGVTQAQISYDLRAVRKAWLESSIRDFDELKAQELAKLDHLEATAWENFERSCRVTIKMRSGRVKHDKKAGDVRWLQAVFSVVETRLKCLGLLKPASVKVSQQQTGAFNWDDFLDGLPPAGQPVPDLINEELQRALSFQPSDDQPLAENAKPNPELLRNGTHQCGNGQAKGNP
jgi:predicted transcriptional regulator